VYECRTKDRQADLLLFFTLIIIIFGAFFFFSAAPPSSRNRPSPSSCCSHLFGVHSTRRSQVRRHNVTAVRPLHQHLLHLFNHLHSPSPTTSDHYCDFSIAFTKVQFESDYFAVILFDRSKPIDSTSGLRFGSD
jgi:hypothetical protein